MKIKGMFDITLLYAEDNEELRILISEYLVNKVKKLLVAKNSGDAFNLYLKYKPQIILIDFHALWEAIKFSQKIRENGQTPILYVSNHLFEEKYMESISLNNIYFIDLPLYYKNIINKIDLLTHNSFFNKSLI